MFQKKRNPETCDVTPWICETLIAYISATIHFLGMAPVSFRDNFSRFFLLIYLELMFDGTDFYSDRNLLHNHQC